MPVELGASTFALRSVTRKDRSLGGSGVPLRFREDRHAGPARYLFFLDTLRKKPHSSLLAKISKLRVLKAEEINSLQPVRASDGTLEVVSEYLACHGHPRSSRPSLSLSPQNYWCLRMVSWPSSSSCSLR